MEYGWDQLEGDGVSRRAAVGVPGPRGRGPACPDEPETCCGRGPTTRSRTAWSTGRAGKRNSRPPGTGSPLLLHAHRDEIAFVNSTTQGIGLIAEGFPWRDGDSVVVPAEEYPSNIYPWMNLAVRGVSVRLVPSREGRIWPEDLVEAMDSTTRVLAISHVEFASGFRNDLDRLAELCHARGVALFVDAIQGLGPLVIDVREDADRLPRGRWAQMAPGSGGGRPALRPPRLDRPLAAARDRLAQRRRLLQLAGDRPAPQAQRPALGGGLVQHARTPGAGRQRRACCWRSGLRSVSRRILERAAAVRELAARAGWRVTGSKRPEDLSGIVAIEHDDVPAHDAAKALRQQGIAVCARRGRLRVSPHVYNNDEDLERLRTALIDCRRHV